MLYSKNKDKSILLKFSWFYPKSLLLQRFCRQRLTKKTKYLILKKQVALLIHRLLFSEKQNLFVRMDDGKMSKHWVLTGNYLDSTLLKNNLAYILANDVFDNISYNFKYQKVDLYINNEYRGVYTIYEHMLLR